MIFPEDKLKIASKMLEEAWDRCPLEAADAGQHWMAVAHMLQVVLDYEEEARPVIDYEEAVRASAIDYREGGESDAYCDGGAG